MRDWDTMHDDDAKADVWLRVEAAMLGVMMLMGIGYLLSALISN